MATTKKITKKIKPKTTPKKPKARRKTPNQLAAGKLNESELNSTDAKNLGIATLTPDQTAKLFPGQKVAGLKLNYYDLKGKLRKEIYRVRFLEFLPGEFGELPEKPIRYKQKPGTPPAVYFPKIINWKIIAKDTDQTIVITEGELKAACAAKFGINCCGLGGVNSYASKKLGVKLIQDLKDISWSGRDVVICFDSDARSNPNIAAATAGLVMELQRRGALPRVAQLPDVDLLKKTGLDDYVKHAGIEALREVIETAEGDELALKIHEFNEHLCVITDPCVIYDTRKKQIYPADKFRTVLFSNVWADKQIPTKDGVKVKTVKVAGEWIDSPLRREYASMIYKPGSTELIDVATGPAINVWPGLAVAPKKGSVEPWHELLDFLFDGGEPEARQWFESWLLYPLKHLGTKMLTSACIWGLPQGVGKSLIGETLSHIYGKNYSLIGQRDLESDFNGWAVYKQFVMIDDVSPHDSRSKADLLKKTITQPTIEVSIKYVAGHQIIDVANYLITSNRPNALYVERGDRRYFIFETKVTKRSPEFYAAHHAWLANGGPAALLHYAMHEHKFGKFSPHQEPPMTQAKREMTSNALGELDTWLADIRDDPEESLAVGGIRLKRDIWTPSEMGEHFKSVCQGRPVAANTMGVHLQEFFPRAADGQGLRPNGRVERFYIIRNREKWEKATNKQITDYIAKCRAREEISGDY